MADNVVSLRIDNNLAMATFPRHARLRNPQQFKQTFSLGRRINTPLFRLHARLVRSALDQKNACIDPAGEIESTDENTICARLGIAVSKRVDAHAIGRNRIKRIARESFRAMRARLPAGDYVLLAQREAAHANNAQLVHALDALWMRAIALVAAEPAATELGVVQSGVVEAGPVEAGTIKSGAVALKRDPTAITMPPRDMLVADPGRPPESP